jgi:hypothetical protein
VLNEKLPIEKSIEKGSSAKSARYRALKFLVKTINPITSRGINHPMFRSYCSKSMFKATKILAIENNTNRLDFDIGINP